MAVNGVDGSGVTQLGLGVQQGKKNDDLGRNDFMKLMVTQLNNQDPMKPMQDGEFFTQIAQFSAVSGMEELQKSFNTLSSVLRSNQALQASSMIGRQVLVPMQNISTAGKESIQGVVDIPVAVNNATVEVYDQVGQLVDVIQMGVQSKGSKSFEWDMKDRDDKPVVEGVYTFKAYADFNGENYALRNYVSDKVDSVSIDPNTSAILLNLSNSGSMNIENIKQIM